MPGGTGHDGGMRATRARLAVVATFAAHGLVVASWTPRIPEVKAALHLSPGELGLLLFAAPVGAVLAMPPAGAGCARWGSARVTRLLLTGYCLAAGLLGAPGGYPVTWAALFVIGALMGALDVAMNAQGVTVEVAYGRPILGGFHATWSLAAMTGTAVGGLAAGWSVPLGIQLAGLGALALAVVLPLTRAFLPDRPREHAARTRRFVRPTLPLVLLGAVGFAAMLAEGAAADWSAVFLRESLGAPAALAGWGYGAFSLTMTAGRLVVDRLVGRYGRLAILAGGAAFGAAGAGAGLATGTVTGAIVGFGLLGCGLAAMVPVVFSAAGDGPGIAFVSTCGYVGWLVGPVLLGGVAEVAGLPVAIWLIPALTALAGLVAPFAVRQRAPGTGTRAGNPGP